MTVGDVLHRPSHNVPQICENIKKVHLGVSEHLFFVVCQAIDDSKL